MEMTPETGKYFADLGIFTIGHIGIMANRLRTKRTKIDVYLEHVVSHSLRPLYFIGAVGLLKLSSETLKPTQAALAGIAWGVIYDGVIPPIRERSVKAIQWDQLAANLIGAGIYLAIAQAVV